MHQAGEALATRLFSEAQAAGYDEKWRVYGQQAPAQAQAAPRGPDPQSSAPSTTSSPPTSGPSAPSAQSTQLSAQPSSPTSTGIQNAPPAGPDPVITTRLDRLIKGSREARIAAGLDLPAWMPIVNGFAGMEVCGAQGFEPVKELNKRGGLTQATIDRWDAGLSAWVAARTGGAA